jgi:hypothetical protein
MKNLLLALLIIIPSAWSAELSKKEFRSLTSKSEESLSRKDFLSVGGDEEKPAPAPVPEPEPEPQPQPVAPAPICYPAPVIAHGIPMQFGFTGFPTHQGTIVQVPQQRFWQPAPLQMSMPARISTSRVGFFRSGGGGAACVGGG